MIDDHTHLLFIQECLQRIARYSVAGRTAILSAVVNPQTGRLISTDANAAVNKTSKLHTGKTGKLLAGTGKRPDH